MNDVVAGSRPPLERILGLGVQILIIIGLEKVYEASRGIVPRQDHVALSNGLAVVHLEKTLHIFDEWHLQRFVLGHKQWDIGPLILNRDVIVSAINHFYLYSHFIGTLLFLAWLYWFRRRQFPFVRNLLTVTSALAMVIYIVFPMMPPRLMGQHMDVPQGWRVQDTLAPLINYTLQQHQIGYNPYAAMPSLHFAWALVLGVTLALIGRHWLLRAVGVLYPFMMLATILISGNHLLLDAVGSVVVVTISVAITLAIHRRFKPRAMIGRQALAA
ncbi:MAG: phosphatase PAP2 family protein [Chloroflexota bacterium]|nr:phosphatase PAP2 family protein [Chloroflexota bacterium]